MIPDPIFMIGTGRCGSSIVAHILSHHPALSYLTRTAHDYPNRPMLNRIALKSLALPGAREILGRYASLSEAYRYWEHYAQGFADPIRDLTEEDVTCRKVSALRSAIEDATIPSRPRFFAKITGWGRMGYLHRVFPGARFVHLVRDGRDVANSLLHVPFWDGWRGPGRWRYGELSEEDQQTWDNHGRSFIVLAGLAWKKLIGSIEMARSRLEDVPYHEVRYEDIVREPVARLEDIVEFCGLSWDRTLDECLEEVQLHDQTGRHQQDLYDRQIRALTEALAGPLARYDYLNDRNES